MSTVAIALPVPATGSRSVFGSIPLFHYGMAWFCAFILTLAIILTDILNMSGCFDSLESSAFGVLVLVSMGAYCCWAGIMPKVRNMAFGFAWAIPLIPSVEALCQAAGRSPFPLIDKQLLAIDRAFGFSMPAIVHFMSRFPMLVAILNAAYITLPFLFGGTVLVLLFTGRNREIPRLLAALFLGTAITACLFAFLPAAGPWTSGLYEPSAFQSEVTARLAALKSDGAIGFGTSAVICFPSFHVLMALLPVFALWPIRCMRFPVAVISTLICISTVTTGWHYGVDVAGGIAVAFLSWHLTARRETLLPVLRR